MSLDTVAEDIRDEARARAEEIRAEAEAEAEEIVAEAEDDAAEIREDRAAAVEREIAQEREQRISGAKLEAKQARLEARRDVLDDVRSAVESAIADIEGDRRRELTELLLADAAEEFDDGDVSVFARPEDEDLVRDLVADYDGFEYGGERECLGGVFLESEGSRVRIDNTFDSVFEDVWEDNIREISAELFEEG